MTEKFRMWLGSMRSAADVFSISAKSGLTDHGANYVTADAGG
jgi:hypothetical protein